MLHNFAQYSADPHFVEVYLQENTTFCVNNYGNIDVDQK